MTPNALMELADQVESLFRTPIGKLQERTVAIATQLRTAAAEGETLSDPDKDVAVAQAVELAEYVERQAKGTMVEAACKFLSLPYAQEIKARLTPTDSGAGRDGEKKECEHPSHTAQYDHIRCIDCGRIRTDGSWGIASHKWFKSVAVAKFYRENGRLPDAIAGAAGEKDSG